MENDLQPSEEALWHRSLAGDELAFGDVYELNHRRVYAHALRLADTVHDAEDVTAMAFLELWRRRRDVRLVGGSVAPWLLVTVTNVARNSRRTGRRYRRLLEHLPHCAQGADAAEAALARAGLDGLNADLRSALKALKETDLNLFCLIAIEDLTVANAAEILKISPGAAKARYHRIRHQLQRAMDHELIKSPDIDTEG